MISLRNWFLLALCSIILLCNTSFATTTISQTNKANIIIEAMISNIEQHVETRQDVVDKLDKLQTILPLAIQVNKKQGNTTIIPLLKILQKKLPDTIDAYQAHYRMDEILNERIDYQPKNIINTKTYQPPVFKQFPEIDNALLSLQNYLIQQGTTPYHLREKMIAERTTMQLDFSFDPTLIDDNKTMPIINASAVFSLDGIFDLLHQQFNTNLGLQGKADIQIPQHTYTDNRDSVTTMQSLTINADIQATIKSIKNIIYATLNQLAIDAKGDMVNENDKDYIQWLTTQKELNTVFPNTYLMLSGIDHQHLPYQISNLLEQTQSINIQQMTMLMKTPLIKFIYQDGNTRYGIPSPKLCEIKGFYEYDDVNQCKHDLLKEILTATDNKGFITLQKEGDSYSLGISSKYVVKDKKEMEDELGFLLDKQLLTWTNDKIVKIDIPLGKSSQNYFLYDHGDITGYWVDNNDGNDTVVKVNGTTTNDNIALQGTVTVTDTYSQTDPKHVVSTFDLKMGNNNNTKTLDVDVIVNVQQTPIFTLHLRQNTTTNILSSINITIPHQTISWEVLKQQMGKVIQ